MILYIFLNVPAAGTGEFVGFFFLVAVIGFFLGFTEWSRLHRWDDATIKEAILWDRGTGKGYYSLTDNDVAAYRASMRKTIKWGIIIGIIFLALGIFLLF